MKIRQLILFRMRPLCLIVTLSLFFLVCSACQSSTKSSVNEVINTPTNPSPSESVASVKPNADSTNNVPLSKQIEYKAVQDKVPTAKISSSDVIKTPITKNVGGVTYFVFSKKSDKENYYLGAQVGSTVWDYGIIGYGQKENLDLIQFKSIHLGNNKEMLKIAGACGSACPVAIYFNILGPQPNAIIRLEKFTEESDIDKDGVIEIIANVGMPHNTEIYKLKDSQVLSTNLNELLGAANVEYDNQKNSFIVTFPGSNEQYEYMIDNDKIKIKK
ncbi:hypothetical protein ACFQZT_15095 [Paenibacillus sp. GCM10027628]|uniref:hypothetical protein n=1 Tax=Paenibacillus sp. GCM10027628 TaxID=3273413 RepID=UPI00362D4FE7